MRVTAVEDLSTCHVVGRRMTDSGPTALIMMAGRLIVGRCGHGGVPDEIFSTRVSAVFPDIRTSE
jgi:hypothetical protein